MAALTAPRRAVEEALASAHLPESVETLGPLPAGEESVRYLLRAPSTRATPLASALTALRRVRSAHKEAVTVATRLDPPDIGS